VVGSVGEVMVKAALELLSAAMSIGVVPEFLIEICCVAPVPITTSPKSTDDGVVTTAFDAGVEKALAFDPQPVSPMQSRREQARNAIAPSLYSGEGVIDSGTGGQSNSLAGIRNEEVRFLLIRASPKRSRSGASASRCRKPAELGREEPIGAASV
jgi:hypothetical protein